MDVGRLERYFDRAVANGERSGRTAEKYLAAVRRFGRWRDADGEPTPAEVKEYLQELWYEDEITGASVNVYKCAIGKYFSVTGRAQEFVEVTDWASDHFTITTDESFDYFEEDELDAVKQAASRDARQHAMVYILSETGIRISELVALERDSVNHADGYVTVQRLKRRDRVVHHQPLSDTALDVIDGYFDVMHEYGPVDAVASDALFFTGVNSSDGWYMSADYARILLKRVARRCSHPKVTADRMHPHLFRHTVGYRLAMQGRSAAEIKEFLGQKSVEAAQRYIHFDPERRGEMHELLSDE